MIPSACHALRSPAPSAMLDTVRHTSTIKETLMLAAIAATVLTVIGLILFTAAVLYAVTFLAVLLVSLISRAPMKPQQRTTLDGLMGEAGHTLYR